MSEMYTKSTKAYAKINIALDITGRRDDGYHLVDMIMQTIDIYDDITIDVTDSDDITMECDNPSLACDESNLCIKAARAVLKEYDIRRGIHITLKKRIPMAAGLAGGSTDAAAVAKCVRDLFNIDATDDDLERLMVAIGADVPYLIKGGLARARGIGEVLDKIYLDKKPIHAAFDKMILLIKPRFDVSTKEVYVKFDSISSKEITHPNIDNLVSCISSKDLDGLFLGMGNVLEFVTIQMHPQIDGIKSIMKDSGALVSLMSGSGPSVFGVFDNEHDLNEAKSILERQFSDADIFVTKAI